MLRTLFGLTSLVLLLVFIGYAATGAPGDPGLTDLSLTASPVRAQNGTWRLQFDLQYTGEKPVVVSERSLPWKSPRDLLLVVAPLNSARTRLAELDSPPPAPPQTFLTLNPGDTLAGSVNLSARFPGLTAAIQEGEVIVFWSHQIRSMESPALPRLNGGVVISRQN
jgi:hypothetical protein